MPNNPTTSVVRSKEGPQPFEKYPKLARWFQEMGTKGSALSVAQWSRFLCDVNEVINQLEASQPKPQSEVGLREQVETAIGKICQAMDKFSEYDRLGEAVDILNNVEAALSQAPVPMSGAVEVAEYIEAICIMHSRDAKTGCRVSLAMPEAAAIIQKAMDGATAKLTETMAEAAKRIRKFGGPTSAAVLLENFEPATQPPAADGKLREALEWYGEQSRLCRLIHREGDAGRNALAKDGGKRARAALAQPASGGGAI